MGGQRFLDHDSNLQSIFMQIQMVNFEKKWKRKRKH